MTDKPFIERTENARALDLTNIPDDLSWLFDKETNDHFDLFAAHGMCGHCWKQQHECECGDELRLQELYAEFEAAREAEAFYCENINAKTVWQRGFVRNYMLAQPATIRAEEVDEAALGGDTRLVALAARRYIIARDFNEFRDGHWQTLWKLTYGGSL